MRTRSRRTRCGPPLSGPDHNDIQGQPGCARVSSNCVDGVYGYVGYITAWFMDRLSGDTRAHSFLRSGTGELFSPSPNWSNQVSNITR